jgi:ribokinase
VLDPRSLADADAGREPVDGLGPRERALDDRAPGRHPARHGSAQLDAFATARDANQIVDGEGVSGERYRHDPDSLAHVPVRLTVVGSINLDFVARTERLPRAGETVTGASFARVPGGKGANQAVAAARLGAEVTMIGSAGDDDLRIAALAELTRAGVDLARVKTAASPTGVALVLVDSVGENAIVVAPGANEELRPEDVRLPDCDGVLCQLEIPLETVEHAAMTAPGEFFLNAAPARTPVPAADLTIVNRYELEELAHRDGLIAVTLGAEGAMLLEDGHEVARAVPPPVEAVDGTGAGDAFTACLVVSLLEGRAREEALRRACVAGALAASRFGAQTSLPTAGEVDALL